MNAFDTASVNRIFGNYDATEFLAKCLRTDRSCVPHAGPAAESYLRSWRSENLAPFSPIDFLRLAAVRYAPTDPNRFVSTLRQS